MWFGCLRLSVVSPKDAHCVPKGRGLCTGLLLVQGFSSEEMVVQRRVAVEPPADWQLAVRSRLGRVLWNGRVQR